MANGLSAARAPAQVLLPVLYLSFALSKFNRIPLNSPIVPCFGLAAQRLFCIGKRVGAGSGEPHSPFHAVDHYINGVPEVCGHFKFDSVWLDNTRKAKCFPATFVNFSVLSQSVILHTLLSNEKSPTISVSCGSAFKLASWSRAPRPPPPPKVWVLTIYTHQCTQIDNLHLSFTHKLTICTYHCGVVLGLGNDCIG